MALDPQIQPLVDQINAAALDAPPIAEQTVDFRRQGYMGLAAIAGPGPEVESVVDGDLAGVPVRTYANAGAVGVFVFFHGGGWVIGDRDTHDQVCRQLAVESGATVISVDYRLAPEAVFPAAVDDCWAVVSWLDAHRDDYGAGSRIVVGGDSAGATLSAVMAIMARDAGVDLAAQLLVYPSVDSNDNSPSMTENATGYVLSRETMEWFRSKYQPDPTDWRASPILADDLSGVAPALIITAQYDPLRDQGPRYAEALDKAGVVNTLTNYEGMVHVFFQLGPICTAAARAVTQVADYAKAALRS